MKELLTALFMLLSALSFQSAAQSLGLDGGFNAGVTNASVGNYVSAVQADGKILVGGSFRFVNGVQRSSLTRLNPDGTLDLMFNAGGSGPNGDVLEIVLIAGGKILIGGAFSSYNGTSISELARLNADGKLDTTFNVGGPGVTGGRITSLSVQTDGKIVASGQGNTAYNGNPSIGIFRANADGSFDSSFVSGYAANPSMEQAILQTDGKIIIAQGINVSYGGNPGRYCIRVNTNGTLDTTFNMGGSGPDSAVAGLGIQTDGKILIGGDFSTYNGTPRTAIARLNTDGTLDTSFVPPTVAGFVEYFAIQTDGKVLASGALNFSNGFVLPVMRLDANGTLDTSLNSLADSYGYHVTLQTDGKILVTGGFNKFSTGENHDGVARFAASGGLDNTFNPSLTGYGAINAMVQQTDGKTIVAGRFRNANGNFGNNIARFNTDGTFDNTFVTGQGTSVTSSNFSASANALAIQPDGKILLGGFFGTFNGSTQKVLIRLNSNGSVDTSFNFSGDIDLDLLPNIENILVLPDNKIIIGGSMRNSLFQIRGLLRLNSNGSVDETFNSGGIGANGTVWRVLRQSDGKYIIAGQFTTYNGTSRPRVARVNTDGTLDTSFTVGTGATISVLDAALQPDGKIIIGGGFTNYNGTLVNRIARLNADGTLDTSFNVGTGANNLVNALTIQPDGKVLIGGSFSNVGGTIRYRLARLNTNGSLDNSLYSGFDHILGFVNAMLLQPDGKLIVGGTFTNYNGTARNNIARLKNAPSVSNGKIVFNSARDDLEGDIFTMNADGSNQIRLTINIAVDLQPQWSPDGTKIVFRSERDGGGLSAIYTMNADGSNQTRLTNNGFDVAPAWSPDGTRIVYRSTRMDGNPDIYVMNANGTNQVRLTTAPANESQPKWSPNGAEIVFRDDRDGNQEIYKMNADGTNQTRLTNSPGDDINPDWSPDGSRIAFTSIRDGNYELYAMNADGTNQARLTISLTDDGFASWSPDGAKIAFTTNRDGDYEIYSIDASGANPQRLTNVPDADGSPDWQPSFTNRAPFDFDGDGKTDIGVFRPAPGEWWINRSSNDTTFALQLGGSSDKIVPADFTGDGKADVAVWRPSTGEWFIVRSEDLSFFSFPFGANGDVPVPADYDGDGKSDAAVFRESTLTWFISKSSGGTDIIGFGAAGDKPVAADYDGDGKADIAIYRANGGVSEWWIRRSSDGTVFAAQFGASTDKAVQGDYTGDGKTDIAVWRPSTGFWFILRSEDFSFFAFPFGANGDTPVPGDYDGDGKHDAGVFRPSSNTWFVQRSTAGTLIQDFGISGDLPIPSAFVR